MNCWTRIVRYWNYLTTPAAPSLEEAEERWRKTKP